jgi:hypothetical protein
MFPDQDAKKKAAANIRHIRERQQKKRLTIARLILNQGLIFC